MAAPPLLASTWALGRLGDGRDLAGLTAGEAWAVFDRLGLPPPSARPGSSAGLGAGFAALQWRFETGFGTSTGFAGAAALRRCGGSGRLLRRRWLGRSLATCAGGAS